jgi:beta-1,4-mannosyl-glycoprotein beta-1,4-N-acetylglucosaminyltransferase
MKVVDCFTFYNELDLLEIRLNELDEVVDNFVIVEAEKTHQNEIKPLYYQEAADDPRFKKWKDRIINVVVPASEFKDDTWYNENTQFRAITRGLSQFEENDLIMVGAADEIPNKNMVKEASEKLQVPMVFHQKLYYFYLNTLYSHNGSPIWPGTTIQKLQHLPQDIIQLISSRTALPPIFNGGWHFSYLGNEKAALNKIHSYAHDEFKGHVQEEDFKKFREELSDPLGRGHNKSHCIAIEGDDWLPTYVRENKEKFKEYIRHGNL